ncbi:glycine zipper 2TM domain-containing protein [Pseudoduganella aquatica]|uniref:glycine zipper 2TM domain-containing protein n=1 Tax=Pseudoduganella aquatica TaxID=2660641 RepID=UPI001E4049A3|nr:glycine zipper 2TM domain-containing protein [Pseudoduganella aquatica]
MNTTSLRTNHPLLLAAAIAVILFCSVGIAAVMGWLPNSNSTPSPRAELPVQAAAAPLPEAQGQTSYPGYHPGPGPGSSLTPVPPPANRSGADAGGGYAPAAEPQRVAQAEPAAPAVCKSCGVVESVREVNTRAQGSGLGAGAGAVVGGLLGHQIGGGTGRQLATVAGAVGGAVVGNQVEGNMRATRSYTIKVRMDDGSYRTFHRSAPNWQQGERVRVVKGELRHG